MAKSTKFDVRYLSTLAKLKLKKKDFVKYEKQLILVLEYFEEIKKVETGVVVPVSQTTKLENVLREDLCRPMDGLSAQEATSNTDKTFNNYFKVSALLNKDE